MRREKLREMRDEMRPFAGLGWDTLQDGNCVVSAPASDAVTVVVIPTSMACPNPAQAACWAGPLLFPTGKEVRGKGARSPLGVSPNSGFQVQRRRQRHPECHLSGHDFSGIMRGAAATSRKQQRRKKKKRRLHIQRI